MDKRTAIGTVAMGLLVASVVLGGALGAGAMSAASTADCGTETSTGVQGEASTECDGSEEGGFMASCIHIDPWRVPTHVEIHEEHC